MKFNWYKNAIIYSLDIEYFYDSNHDGIGDFRGLIDKLDYLAALGITCLWILPFFPSSNRDNGYDVTDYYNVDPELGCLGDFTQLVDKANVYGIKIIIDLVVNHTSIEHPWFQEARRNPKSRYRDYYVWSDEPEDFEIAELVFVGEENTMWTYDEVAKQYYLHRFYKEQPDLNIMNADVRDEILKIMGFWLSLGVSGFRVDAAAIIIESYGMKGAEKEELERFFEEMRSFLAARKTDAILLAEANINPADVKVYMRGETRMHMMFNFFTNQHLFLSLARENAGAIKKAMDQVPTASASEQWLNFLRHHDELTLEKLSEEEKKEIFKRFGPRSHMQIYDRGIRRRLAPMVKGDPQMLRLCYSLLMSLPGVPMIRYGDEIGMGDDLSLEGRDAVKTPMQWTSEPNGGFSRAEDGEFIKTIIGRGPFAYKKINVLDAQSNADSLLNWIERLIGIRKQCPEIGTGKLEVMDSGDDRLLLHHFKSPHGDLWFAHNFSKQKLSFDQSKHIETGKKWVQVFGSHQPENNGSKFSIAPHGFHWWRTIRKK
jgi:maltose alpha-D-glucosyltransferase / alpha-amylase